MHVLCSQWWSFGGKYESSILNRATKRIIFFIAGNISYFQTNRPSVVDARCRGLIKVPHRSTECIHLVKDPIIMQSSRVPGAWDAAFRFWECAYHPYSMLPSWSSRLQRLMINPKSSSDRHHLTVRTITQRAALVRKEVEVDCMLIGDRTISLNIAQPAVNGGGGSAGVDDDPPQ